MSNKTIPSLSEFRKALQASKGHEGQSQLAALEKVITYAAYAAGYSPNEIEEPEPKSKRRDQHIQGEGWRLPRRVLTA